MGRHRLHAAPRRRGGGRRRTAVRTGLLGASVAVVLGTAAVATGMVPVGGSFPYIGTGPAARTEARATPAPDPGATRGDGSADPSGRASASPGTSPGPGTGPASPSASPSPSASAPTSAPASPSPSASPDGSSAPASSTPAPARTQPQAPSPRRSTAPARPTGPATSRPVAPPAGAGHSAEETAVLALVNQARAQAGCAPVRADPPLAALAGAFSKDMAVRGFFGHTDPDGNTPWDRAAKAGITGLGGENIARGQGDAASVMTAWMDSPDHRKNIVNCEFRTLGVGAHFAGGGPWWTQDFGY